MKQSEIHETISVPVKEFPKFIFWDRNKNAKVPLSLAIERVILYGDIEHIIKLFKMFDKSLIIKRYQKKIKPNILKKDKALAELVEIILESL